jgi:hypothetical protein
MATAVLRVGQKLAEYGARGWANYVSSQNCVFALLSVPTGSTGCAFDGGTDRITLSAAQTWPTKTKVRFVDQNGGLFGTPPSISPLSQGTDYYLIRVSSTEFRVASSRADAIAGTFIQLPTLASGSYNVIAQTPNDSWPIGEVVDWEVAHPLYTARYYIGQLSAPVSTGGLSTQRIVITTISNNSGTTFTYNAIAILESTTDSPGDSFGTVINVALREVDSGFGLSPAPPVSIADGVAPVEISYNLSAAYG